MASIYRRPGEDHAEPRPRPQKATSLGALKSTHVRAGQIQSASRIVTGGRVPVLVAPILIGLFAFPQAPIVAVILIGMAGCVGLVAALDGVIRARNYVALHQNGIAVVSWNKRREMLFEDVDSVWFTMAANGGVPFVRLVPFQGEPLRVPIDLQNGNKIIEEIDAACSAPLTTDAILAIDAGSPLHFGDIELTRKTISIGDERLTWADIRTVKLCGPRVELVTAKDFYCIRLSQVPHPRLFLRMLDQYAPKILVSRR